MFVENLATECAQTPEVNGAPGSHFFDVELKFLRGYLSVLSIVRLPCGRSFKSIHLLKIEAGSPLGEFKGSVRCSVLLMCFVTILRIGCTFV